MKTYVMEGLHESLAETPYSSAQASMKVTEEQLGHPIVGSSQ